MLPTTLNAARSLLLSLAVVGAVCAEESTAWPEKGRYEFKGWAGPSIGVCYSVPPDAGPESPILIVVPGARRNADIYRDAWHSLALANGFIVLAIEAGPDAFPTEYDYNAGGVTAPDGRARPRKKWTYSAIEPLFDDFRRHYGSSNDHYSIYGHSAGGQFVHTFLLFTPDARATRAVAANPAFFMMPLSGRRYPFGPRGALLGAGAVKKWLAAPLVIVLGDRDLGPRTRPLSNSPRAREQGPNVLARGLRFYHEALVLAESKGTELAWKLDVLQGVGHSNENVAPRVVRYLFPE